MAYLSINNKVSFRSPIDADGNNLPRYFRNTPSWVAYREALQAMIPMISSRPTASLPARRSHKKRTAM